MNINSDIVGTNGRTLFAFGGETAHKTTIFRGYLVSLEWFVGARSTEPMMVLRHMVGAGGAFGICLSSIGKYADPSGGPAEGALEHCLGELDGLGRPIEAQEARKLLDVILQFTPELIAMPVMPRDARDHERAPAILEITTKDADGKRLAEVKV